jgi:hypothetical protein
MVPKLLLVRLVLVLDCLEQVFIIRNDRLVDVRVFGIGMRNGNRLSGVHREAT